MLIITGKNWQRDTFYWSFMYYCIYYLNYKLKIALVPEFQFQSQQDLLTKLSNVCIYFWYDTCVEPPLPTLRKWNLHAVLVFKWIVL